ncbi:MAG: DUF1566 domain-containing protein [Candidatus Electrothrix sp. GW3-4]|uniref:Lcl C-terminal domain-containing protein n=1 Tax=Candidatus Electrothrix sp. GW3-4 TaxID=3126740 RepID=UPI0030D1A8DE
MRILVLMLCCIFSAVTAHAALQQICRTDTIPASTPDSSLIDHGNGTVTDSKTGLMWKKCLEGAEGTDCEIGSPSNFTWQGALQQPGTVNASGGFAGYQDWRLPNIRELYSLVEEQCYSPAINLNRFPNTPQELTVWSGSPCVTDLDSAWSVFLGYGYSKANNRNLSSAVRLVRGGQ